MGKKVLKSVNLTGTIRELGVGQRVTLTHPDLSVVHATAYRVKRKTGQTYRTNKIADNQVIVERVS